MDTFVLTYDLGTTGCKTCLYRIGTALEPVGESLAEYPLLVTADGGAEQKADDWWHAICSSTRSVLEQTSLKPDIIKGISFCCQMQGSIFVNRQGKALRHPMIYMDSRATSQMEAFLSKGILRISGMNAIKALNMLRITGGVAATPKTPYGNITGSGKTNRIYSDRPTNGWM